ncbi:MAG: acetyl-CoA carboxylase biotin carboxyl carrier protein subunit [Bacteroidales bacterium]|jgi:biotin carboxyl carrier protein|nr:acetyl-CoA carboxylase biotin carboxyl carrier protein subunit [Bacteroidales bacterium]
MKKFKFTINGTDYESEILSLENNLALIEVNGTPYEVVLHRETKESKTPTLVRSEVKEPVKGIEKKNVVTKALVKSPLPGIITKINVSPGDKVIKNQVLYCLEAMKMENQIKSEREGTVSAVKVTVGQAVLQEEVIIELD